VTSLRGSSGAERPAPRLYYLHHRLVGPLDAFAAEFERIAGLGFTGVLLSPVFEAADGNVFHPSEDRRAAESLAPGLTPEAALGALAGQAGARGLQLWLDLDLCAFDARHPLVQAHPDCFDLRAGASWAGPVDPRREPPPPGLALARFTGEAGQALLDWACERLHAFAEAGVAGARALHLDRAPAGFWARLIAAVRVRHPHLCFLAWTPGVAREAALALKGCGFDVLASSLPWWDGRARWLVEEHEALRVVAPLLAPCEAPFGPRAARGRTAGHARAACEHALDLAAATGAGLLMPMGFEYGARERLDPAGGDPEAFRALAADPPFDLSAEVRVANAVTAELARLSGEMRLLTPAGSKVTALLRTDAPDARAAEVGLLALVNGEDHPAEVLAPEILPRAGADFGPFERLGGGAAPFAPLGPAEVRLLLARHDKAITTSGRAPRAGARAAAARPRLVIEGLSPAVEGGPFPVRRVVGEEVFVEADVFAEGHAPLAVELLWRPQDQEDWRRERMAPLGNDRWRGVFVPDRLGRWEFTVEGWIDVFGGWREGLRKKLAAGVAETVDFEEGRLLVLAAAERSEGELKARLKAVLEDCRKAGPEGEAGRLLDADTLEAMQAADDRPFALRLQPVQLLDAERLSARFASWYELFPRSQSDSPDRHGTFDDVIARLPDVREMGFDVLYFPPIHPIGRTNRKGRNNALTAAPDDPGSPYAIGSEEGGHTAIHPELGSLEDFRRLVAAAREHGLEIALDFAIQCSPDHPWLKEHPDWFDWRPDGTIKFAENPPKTYEDIVNVDFYQSGAVPDLWCALRDAVVFWIREGVRTFRVDNPHTKPLPFWEWMIADVRRVWPDVIFLAEAFTRPKLMYRLAKIGFSQSYTYFTWRHSKTEFTDYLTELTTTPPKEFFRPHFFVNTPDINPYFLQHSGRAGFLIRAVLAATLSGLWGVYSGFELLEGDPIPGKEEYRHSEKYEIKPRDWHAPGNIRAEIARLNRIRRNEPALQSHLGLSFYNAFNDQVLYYGKALPGKPDMVLTAVSLDPNNVQHADFEVPLWEFGLPDHGAVEVVDLLHDRRFVWRGKVQHLTLTPHEPYAIWRIQPLEAD